MTRSIHEGDENMKRCGGRSLGYRSRTPGNDDTIRQHNLSSAKELVTSENINKSVKHIALRRLNTQKEEEQRAEK
jgi:hypothetical protein